ERLWGTPKLPVLSTQAAQPRPATPEAGSALAASEPEPAVVDTAASIAASDSAASIGAPSTPQSAPSHTPASKAVSSRARPHRSRTFHKKPGADVAPAPSDPAPSPPPPPRPRLVPPPR